MRYPVPARGDGSRRRRVGNGNMQANPRKTKSFRPLGEVDISDPRERVLAIPEAVWDAENATKPNKFDALSSTRHIVFRFVTSPMRWDQSYDRPAWAAWREPVMRVIEQAIVPFGYARPVFPRIMLARMAPGGVIHPHVDANPAALWPHKCHVPLTTNPRCLFLAGGEWQHLPAGHAVEVNNMDMHAVRNEGDADRIHLIFEVYDPDQPVAA